MVAPPAAAAQLLELAVVGAAVDVDDDAAARELSRLEVAAEHRAARQDEHAAPLPQVRVPPPLVRAAVGVAAGALPRALAVGELARVLLAARVGAPRLAWFGFGFG